MTKLRGIGSPRARSIHQEIISGTLVNMWDEIKQKPAWKLMCQATVTENPNDNYPDIIVWNESKKLVFSLEITRNWSISYDRRKAIRLKARFPNAEFFIYNYESGILYALKSDNTWADSREYNIMSSLLKKPLLDYIYLPDDY